MYFFFKIRSLSIKKQGENGLDSGRSHRLSSYLNRPCLAVDNLDAHYITCLVLYFADQNKFLDLHHLEIAFHGGHTEATFMLGVLHMSLGMIQQGKKIIANLSLKEESSIVVSPLFFFFFLYNYSRFSILYISLFFFYTPHPSTFSITTSQVSLTSPRLRRAPPVVLITRKSSHIKPSEIFGCIFKIKNSL